MSTRFEVLDSFRGLCAIFVVIFHMKIVGAFTQYSFFRGSDIFVQFFFVLSGFVMAKAYAGNRNLNIRDYFIKRTFRIYPLHVFMLMLFLLLEIALLLFNTYGSVLIRVPFSGKNDLVELLPNIFLLQSWSIYTEKLSFNGPSWSISLEYYMYFLFLFLLVFAKNNKSRFMITGSIIILCLLLSGLEPIFFTKDAYLGIYCFLLGTLTAAVHTRSPELDVNRYVSSLVEFLALVCVFCYIIVDFDYKYQLSGVFFSIIVLLFSYEKGIASVLFKKRIFLFLGLISYSIYLTHYFVLTIIKTSVLLVSKRLDLNFIEVIDEGTFINLGFDWINTLLAILSLIVVIFFSMLTYKYIEVKGQEYGKFILNFTRASCAFQCKK